MITRLKCQLSGDVLHLCECDYTVYVIYPALVPTLRRCSPGLGEPIKHYQIITEFVVIDPNPISVTYVGSWVTSNKSNIDIHIQEWKLTVAAILTACTFWS